MNLPNPLKLLAQQFRIEWKLYARDRGAMFWTFLFPLLMLFGFGVIFRSGGPPALTLVPTDYTGTARSPHLDDLDAALPAGVDVMWTGPTVCSPTITASDARARAAAVCGRVPLVWDNDPVNDVSTAAA